MEITLKNIDILNKLEALKELAQTRMPGKPSWNITKNIKKIEALFKTYVDCEKNLIEQYATKDKNGNVEYDENNQPKFTSENLEKYKKCRQELLECEETIDIIQVKISDLFEDEDIKPAIKPAIFLTLDFMFIDDTN